ncbi:Striatin family-domain-containing protein [Limtongia smithiae]|uniref:Striatin family-domain-containing protein n=1 Tax=Limtongia smithiae TaxID=1125753 RepID=UPI0034D01BEE
MSSQARTPAISTTASIIASSPHPPRALMSGFAPQTPGQTQGGAVLPPGQDYTLQGVMRYLQTQWQRTEKSRIQWEIERAEMKARIARLEGEKRGTEHLLESYAKRIAMLEHALAKERSKSSPASDAPAAEAGAAAVTLSPQQQPEEFIPQPAYIDELEKRREKTRQYLEKCMQEVTYLLVFADSIPVPTAASGISNGGPAPQELSSINVDNSRPTPGMRFAQSPNTTESRPLFAGSERMSTQASFGAATATTSTAGITTNSDSEAPSSTAIAPPPSSTIQIGEHIVSTSPVDEHDAWDFSDQGEQSSGVLRYIE